MTNIVKFSRQVHFRGRNGYFKSIGIHICPWTELDGTTDITVIPLTSRDEEARCMIEIPLEDVPAVIASLQSILKNPK